MVRADTDLLPLPVRNERGEGFPRWANNPPLPGPLLPWWEERERSNRYAGGLIQRQSGPRLGLIGHSPGRDFGGWGNLARPLPRSRANWRGPACWRITRGTRR